MIEWLLEENLSEIEGKVHWLKLKIKAKDGMTVLNLLKTKKHTHSQ